MPSRHDWMRPRHRSRQRRLKGRLPGGTGSGYGVKTPWRQTLSLRPQGQMQSRVTTPRYPA